MQRASADMTLAALIDFAAAAPLPAGDTGALLAAGAPLAPWAIAAACVVGFLAAVVGVITGGNSLVTVPVFISLGMPPRQALATNMFAVTFLALSGAVRFARSRPVRWDLTRPLVVITLATSYLGARLVSWLDEDAVRVAVVASMWAMLIFLVARPRFGQDAGRAVSPGRHALGLAVSAVLGVYGGFFSGGYTTLLTFTCTALLGASLLDAVGLTKIVNFASSGIASVAFLAAGLVDLRLGLPLALAMTAGGRVGAGLAIQRGHGFVRVVFIASIAVLALKLLLLDVLGLMG